MRHALVICIGNKARGDDGAGRKVAELLDGRDLGETAIVSTPQLDVVMAEQVAHASHVIFVDAQRRTAPSVLVDTLEPDTAHTNAHAIDPAGLLALARTLYDADPGATLVTLAGPEMGHGEGLSETAEAASEEAASVVASLIETSA
jgi:hydrogenase maturation protease